MAAPEQCVPGEGRQKAANGSPWQAATETAVDCPVENHEPHGLAEEVAVIVGEAELSRHLVEIEQIYQHAPVGLAFINRDYRITRVNNHLAAIAGSTVEELLGRNIQKIFKNHAMKSVKLLNQVFEDGIPVQDIELSIANGPVTSEQPCLCNYFPFKSATGQILGVIASVLNISVRKQAEEALKN